MLVTYYAEHIIWIKISDDDWTEIFEIKVGNEMPYTLYSSLWDLEMGEKFKNVYWSKKLNNLKYKIRV